MTSGNALRARSGDSFGDPWRFCDGLEERNSWPRRSALVVGTHPDSTLISTLQHLGFSGAVTDLARMDRVAALAGPFTFCLLNAEVFADDSSIELVQSLLGHSPSARTILNSRPEDHEVRSVGDLRQSTTAASPPSTGQLAFGLPAHEPTQPFRPRSVPAGLPRVR